MKFFIKTISLVIMSAAMLVACNDEDDLLKEWIFNVTVTNVGERNAVITIRHNGINADTYQGFVVDGAVENVDACINNWLKENEKADVMNSMTQCKKVLKLSGLRPNHLYTYIVFGIDGNLKAVCKPCAITFETKGTSIDVSENPNWVITFNGTQTYNGSFYSVATLEVNELAKERYFFEFYPVSVREQYANEVDFLEYALDQYEQKHNPKNLRDIWLDILNSTTQVFYRYLDSGDYIAYAIGTTIDGEFTGHFAKTRPIHVDEYPELQEYKRIIGNWTLIDVNGEKCDVTFQKEKVNKSLKMFGLGTSRYFVSVLYDPLTSKLIIPTQCVARNAEFFSNELPIIGTLYTKGWYINQIGNFVFTSNELEIARGSYDDTNGNYEFEPGFIVKSNNIEIKTTKGIVMFIETENKNYTLDGSKLELPITMKKK